MAVKTYTATFTGAQQSIDVSLTGLSAQHILQTSVAPSDGFGAVRPWLTNHFSSQCTVNVPALWQGTVSLIAADSPAATIWPAGKAARVGAPVATSTGGTPEAGGRVYAQPYYVPTDVTSTNVILGNRTYSAGVASFVGNVSVYASDGTGKPTGSALATFTGVTIPGDGTTTTVGPFPVTRGSDGKVVVCIGVPQGTSVAVDLNVQFGYFVTGTTTTSPNPGGWSVSAASVFSVTLEFITARRYLVMHGDSLTVGYSVGTAVGFENAVGNLIAAHKDWAVQVVGIVQFGSLANFANFAGLPFLWDTQKWSSNPDLMCWLGTNDIQLQSLSGMQSNRATILSHFQSLSSGRAYIATIPGQTAFADAGGVRALYNTDTNANATSLGWTAVRDRAAKQNVGGLSDNSTATTLFASYDTGDGVHDNIAGNQQDQTGTEAIL